MRILHVADSYVPCMGGIEMHVSDLAARQQAAGHDVRILTATPSGKQEAGVVPVTRLPWNPLVPGTGRRIQGLVEDEGIEVVHAHLSVGSPLAWSALRIPAAAGRVATMHSVLPNAPKVVRTAMAITGIRWHDVVVTAVSEVAAQPLREAIPGMSVTVLPNGIDPALWKTSRKPVNDDIFTVVSVGRFTRRKRQRALIGMLVELRAALPPGKELRALIVGDGPQFGTVTRDVRRAGFDGCVQLLGTRTRDEIRTILDCADVYLAPARLESFGIAALEARCVGLPVVAMSCSGVGEFIRDGIEGFLVADDADMVAATHALATDTALLQRIRTYNATTDPPMAWERVLDRNLDLYKSAISLNHSRPSGIRSVVV